MAFSMDDYVDVAERIRLFADKYPDGSLQPVDPAQPYRVEVLEGRTFLVYVAAAYRGPADPRPGIGVAWEQFPGKTSYTKDSELQNAETSAWGRAIVAALAADTKKVASRQEVKARQPDAKPMAADPVALAKRAVVAAGAAVGVVGGPALAETYASLYGGAVLADATEAELTTFAKDLKTLPGAA